LTSIRYTRLEKIYERFVGEKHPKNYPAYGRLLMISKTLYPMLHELTHKSYAEAVLRKINQEVSTVDEA